MAIETAKPSWNKSLNPYIQGLEVIQEGDKNGYGAVARFTLQGGREVSVIALPHAYPTRTGPTWAYLMECQGWTLVDAGPRGALDTLEAGLKALGRKLTDLERVIITHGHQDHDGNVYDLVKASGAQLWAHELYFHFLRHGHHDTGLDGESPLHRAMQETRKQEEEWYRRRSNSTDHSHWMDHARSYMNGRRGILEEKLPIHPVQDGEELGGLRFLYTPGHAVDEVCIALRGGLFTGDHILPQISPHPTYKQAYPKRLIGAIPSLYQEAGDHYGLASYLKSLGKVLALDHHTTVLPAHRLFNRGRFHIRNLQRAQDIVRHHERRLERMMEVIGDGATTMAAVTMGAFPPRKLSGGGFFGAVSEVVSHLELLADVGDIQVSPDGRIQRNGTENFHQAVRVMAAHDPG